MMRKTCDDATTYNETNRALARSIAAPLMTNGPISRCMCRRFFESSLQALSSPAMEVNNSTLLGSGWRRLVGVCSDMGVEWKDGGGGSGEFIRSLNDFEQNENKDKVTVGILE